MSAYDYDLLVIGSGPAGEKGAAQAAWFGKKVCLVERHSEVGGACANTGTLPSKTLRETALYLSGFVQRDLYGVRCAVDAEGLSVPQFMVHKDHVVGAERARIRSNLDRHKVDLVRGTARFVDAHTIDVDLEGGGRRTIRAEYVLITTGSSPRRPPKIPFDHPDVEDSDTILQLDRIPKRMIVVGGGVIGCEYASIFACLGVAVTLLEPKKTLLGFLDQEITEVLTKRLRALGIDVLLEDDLERVETEGGLALHTRGGKTLRADTVLIASGRIGNVDGLGLEAAGVAVDERKRIVVDAQFRTCVPTIFAAGDVIGFPALASTGMEQARLAMCHAFGLTYKQKIDPHLPYGLYTIPEVGAIGLSEEDCTRQGIEHEVGRAWYKDNARGQIAGDREGLLKLVFSPADKRLLGVHVIGEKATELVHVGQMCMHFEGTIDAFIDVVFNYPTLSDLYKYAAYDGLGRLARRAR